MLLSWVYKLGALAAVAGTLLAGAYIKGRVDGGRVTEARWQAKIAKAEADWQDRLSDALQSAFKEIEALNEEKQDADLLIEKLRAEALADPAASGCGLGRDSVQRVRRIR